MSNVLGLIAATNPTMTAGIPENKQTVAIHSFDAVYFFDSMQNQN